MFAQQTPPAAHRASKTHKVEAIPQDLRKLPGLGGLAVTVGCLLSFHSSVHETTQLIPLLYRAEEAEAAKIRLILLAVL